MRVYIFIFIFSITQEEKDPLNYMKQSEWPNETIMRGCFLINRKNSLCSFKKL